MLLEGVKVVELATWIAGPGTAAILADWGADVIKVEGSAGDPTRGFYPDDDTGMGNPVFTMANRGKRSVVLDIARDPDHDILIALLCQADVFVTNLRPGSLARARLDYARISAAAPQLIYASITGFGLAGPDVDRPAFDKTAFWSKSGIAAATIPTDQHPFTCRPGFGDHVAALATVSGVLAALHERAATGRGRLVEASLLRAGVYTLGWDLAVQARFGTVTTNQPRDQRPLPFEGYFQTADARWICLVPRGPGCLQAMLRMIGRTDRNSAATFEPPGPSIEMVRELRAATDALFADLTLEEAARMLTAADVIWSPMATPAEVIVADASRDAGCFVELASEGVTTLSPAAPARFPGGAPRVSARAPRLGEDTDTVLAGLSTHIGGDWPAKTAPRE